MNEQPNTTIIENLAEDLTPIAYGAAKNMKERTDAWNEQGGDLQSILDLQKEDFRELLRALAAVELEVRTLKSEVIRGEDGATTGGEPQA